MSRNSRLSLMVVAGVAAALAVVWLGVARTSHSEVNRGDFAGVEAGVRMAVAGGKGVAIGEGDEHNHVRVFVRGMLAEDIQTTVALQLTSDAGRVFTSGDVTLFAPDGTPLRLVGSSSDPGLPGEVTWAFPPLPGEGRGQIELRVESLLVDSGDVPQMVAGPWRVRFDYSLGRSPAAERVLSSQQLMPRSFGNGAIVVDRVVSAPSGTLVVGRLTGFSADELTLFQLRGSIVAGDQKLEPIALRGGFGDQHERWQMRFLEQSGPFELTVVTWFGPRGEGSVPANVAAVRGVSATWTLD